MDDDIVYTHEDTDGDALTILREEGEEHHIYIMSGGVYLTVEKTIELIDALYDSLPRRT